ncbi:hypothetical protein SAMN04487912_111123 [Arthrobacter sp. cf158]|uniref:hypothetical protein n=1 Tax=Arthrobacter sp. cf158 TaxID=1761744 RepID=UPI0008996399|nr:hypothetical protein [Arthrobacter sp. cf158]SDX40128.1 hypothetical protein SAMN04487912_111123 [Arthrobacter sp. cf158]
MNHHLVMEDAPAFISGLVDAADRSIDTLVDAPDGGAAALAHRPAMGRLLAMATVYTQPDSRHYLSAGLPGLMMGCVARLEYLQGPTGLFDGTNLSSPPDSAFTINDACMALEIMDAPAGLSAGGGLAEIATRLRAVVGRITDALLTGGVHTPNHRWELCAALARIHSLHQSEGVPRPEILQRIDQWLAEGVDQLPDGMYSERSPLYASAVTNPSLVAIADHANRPELLEHVRANLAAFLPWFSSDGVTESLFSRRQDQWFRFNGEAFQLLYRRLASQDGNGDFAAAAAWLRQFPLLEPAKALARTRLDPWLHLQLPERESALGGGELPAAMTPGHAVLSSCGIHRYREARCVATIFGGCDDVASGVGSGLASNPTFLRFAHGDAVLTDVRLSRSFFDLGPFRSQGVTLRGSGVRLTEDVSANFYLPLPVDKHREDGLYALGHEGRFSAGMDFGNRPAVEHRLATSITVIPQMAEGTVELELGFEGAHTSFAIELTFRPGGLLSGVEEETRGQPGAYQLTTGTGEYRVGEDVIEFGPGIAADADNPPAYNPGEAYRYLAGTNATDGVKVYITGRTSGSVRLAIRGRSVS